MLLIIIVATNTFCVIVLSTYLEEKSAKAAKKNKKKKKVPSVHSNELTITQALHSLCAGYYKVTNLTIQRILKALHKAVFYLLSS